MLRAEEARRRGWLVVRVLVGSFVVLFFASFWAPLPSRCRSQFEAKGNLKALYVAEESYRGEFDVYNADTDVIGFAPKGNKIRYRYVVTDVEEGVAPDQQYFGRASARSSQHFRAWAFRIDGEREDLWTIDSNNELKHVVNGCEE